MSERLRFVDSHTGGEPTRLIVEGGPDLGGGTVAEQLERLRERHDWLRTAAVCEPRGSEVLVGALLCPPADPACAAGVIFFNNVGYLGMCGHGTIGVMISLAHLGRLHPGVTRIETPVGVVEATWQEGVAVTLTNVPSFRKAKGLKVEVSGYGAVTGDVAWGGNWFFLVRDSTEDISHGNIERLTEVALSIRQAVNEQAFPEVDHLELFGPPSSPAAQSRSFVLCPGRAYDRSPCGTGTSAKLACLAADGLLAEGEAWVQESILGSTFRASYRWHDREQDIIVPTLTGTAFVTMEGTLLLDEHDPFRSGIR